MILNELGKYLAEDLQNITSHCPYAKIPLFVIRPNHVRCVVVIKNENPISDAPSLEDAIKWPAKGSLPVVIRGLKAATTIYANENKIPFAWQSNYHDKIIRSRNEWFKVVEYIKTYLLNCIGDEWIYSRCIGH